MTGSDEDWNILRLPALAEPGDPMGRLVGEALWPALHSTASLVKRRAAVGEHVFQAMYQQRPLAEGGLYFKSEKLLRVATAPAVVQTVRAWDLAATAARPGRNPDWTVGLKLGLLADGRYVVLDIKRLRAEPSEVDYAIATAARLDGAATLIALPQDPGQAGVFQVAHLKRALAGFKVVSSPETGSKIIRATPASALVGAERILVVEAEWTDAFVAELGAFPGGAKDDQVDALSRALATIAHVPTAARAVRQSLMER